MPEKRVALDRPTTELTRAGRVVGLTDGIYEVAGKTVVFGEVLVKGDLSGPLEYNGRSLKITRIDTMIGLEVSGQGARGPVWRGVECEVLD